MIKIKLWIDPDQAGVTAAKRKLGRSIVRTNLAIAALIYTMVQAIIFGMAFIPLEIARAPSSFYFPTIAATFFIAAPIALLLAPRLRSRAWKREHGKGLIPS